MTLESWTFQVIFKDFLSFITVFSNSFQHLCKYPSPAGFSLGRFNAVIKCYAYWVSVFPAIYISTPKSLNPIRTDEIRVLATLLICFGWCYLYAKIPPNKKADGIRVLDYSGG
jgi:hypothetical protein